MNAIVNRLEPLFRTLLVLAVPIVLIASPLYLYVTPGFVRFQYAQSYVAPSSRLEPLERIAISDVIISYLRHSASETGLVSCAVKAGEYALRESEVQHLVDVRHVMDVFYVAHAIALAAILGVFLLALSARRAELLAQGLRRGVWLTLALMALVFSGVALDFDAFFTLFHKLFFEADTWLFYIDDTLIQLYPLGFWVGAVSIMAATIVGEGIVVLLTARWLSHL